MKLHDDGEFTALNWVKQALDATLAQAREMLTRQETMALLSDTRGVDRLAALQAE